MAGRFGQPSGKVEQPRRGEPPWRLPFTSATSSLHLQYTRCARRRHRCSCFRLCFLPLRCTPLPRRLRRRHVPRVQAQAAIVHARAPRRVRPRGNASTLGTFLPEFDATLCANNQLNGKIGVHYKSDRSHVVVSYGGVSLANDVLPTFYQEPMNVTVFMTEAKGRGYERARGQMAAADQLQSVPFDVDVKLPVWLQLGWVKTGDMPVRVQCAMVVNRLAADAKVVGRSCGVKAQLLFWRN